jgi:hypothetical protein
MKGLSKLLLLLSVLLISIGTFSGCATKHTEIVYSSLAPHDEALDSAITIATNEPIPVTVGDTVSSKDLGGHIAVHPSDMKALVGEIDHLQNKLSEKSDE